MEVIYEHLQILRNRMMALRAKIEASPRAGELQTVYGRDLYQEETRCMGLRMMRDGLDQDGEVLILDFTRAHYPDDVETERAWVTKMMRYLNRITETLIDNLLAEGYIALRSNTDLPYENALFYPVQTLDDDRLLFQQLSIHTVLPLDELKNTETVEGWLYFPMGVPVTATT